MRKNNKLPRFYFTLVFMALLPAMSFAQSFVLTPYGLRDSKDTSKTYIILDSLNMTAKQLFDKSANFIKEEAKNPDFAIKSQVDGEYIRFGGYQPEISGFIQKMLFKLHYAINAGYEIELRFRDNKVKYEIRELNLTSKQLNSNDPIAIYHLYQQKAFIGWDQFYVWDKTLQLKNPDIKNDIQTFFNQKILGLKKSLTSTDW